MSSVAYSRFGLRQSDIAAPQRSLTTKSQRIGGIRPTSLRILASAAGTSNSGSTAQKPSTAAAPAGAQNNAVAIKIPRSLVEIDNGKILGFGAGLAEDHPGFHDEAYKRRRVAMSNMARDHVPGQPIPRVEYTPEETEVWAQCVRELEPLWQRHACAEFLKTYPLFNFSAEHVPQLQDLNDVLSRTTGWSIRPTAGLLHPRDFLAGLAFRCFHSTQYVRHHSKPSYTPEPDLVHEALGHMPMLADPAFCDLAAAIGRASLGADDKTIWHLTKVYWYTVEFGVVMEGREVKAFGAGVLSSFGEMENMASGKAEISPFDPFVKLPPMSYKDGYQKRYFALESFEDGAKRLREYCEHVQANLAPEMRAEVEEAIAATSVN